jgi:hypothetical protein
MIDTLLPPLTDSSPPSGYFTFAGAIVLTVVIGVEIARSAIKGRKFCETWHPVWVPFGTVVAFGILLGVDHIMDVGFG